MIAQQVEAMANPGHLSKIKGGVEAWNNWREEHPEIVPNLRLADLHGANLTRVDLSRADLSEADLSGTKLSRAKLRWAKLSRADLRRASLSGAKLRGANLAAADLRRAQLDNAVVAATVFGNNDLSQTKGLGTVRHHGPSTIGIDTIYRSKGKIPESFLRGCGIPDELIMYSKSLMNPSAFYSCFISYSTKDQEFADSLYGDLQNKGVRCWFAPEDLKTGDPFQERIEESIRLYDKLLVVLSENSVNSQWVGREVQAAFEKENKQGATALFPVRLDDAVMDSPRAWAADIRRTRHIGDFRNWKDHNSFQKSLGRLLRDLKSQDSKPKG